MEPNRKDPALPGRLETEIFEAFGETDSIVDRLFSIPVPALDARDGIGLFETGVVRHLERLVADRMRAKIADPTS